MLPGRSPNAALANAIRAGVCEKDFEIVLDRVSANSLQRV
jgi:hypothetical protein